MVKRRSPNSIEEGIQDAIVILRKEGVEVAVRKGASLIRKCADPDNDAYHLQVRDGIALDAACMAVGEAPPIRTAYDAQLKRQVAALGGPKHIAVDPRVRFTEVISEIGDVSDALRGGADGFSRDEIHDARRQIREARVALNRLDADLDALEARHERR